MKFSSCQQTKAKYDLMVKNGKELRSKAWAGIIHRVGKTVHGPVTAEAYYELWQLHQDAVSPGPLRPAGCSAATPETAFGGPRVSGKCICSIALGCPPEHCRAPRVLQDHSDRLGGAFALPIEGFGCSGFLKGFGEQINSPGSFLVPPLVYFFLVLLFFPWYHMVTVLMG